MTLIHPNHGQAVTAYQSKGLDPKITQIKATLQSEIKEDAKRIGVLAMLAAVITTIFSSFLLGVAAFLIAGAILDFGYKYWTGVNLVFISDALNSELFPVFAEERGLLESSTIVEAHKLFQEAQALRVATARKELIHKAV